MRRMLNWLRKRARPHATELGKELPDNLQGALVGLVARLGSLGISHALIGGLGVSALGHVRSTLDIDLLVPGSQRDSLHELMGQLGAECLMRNEDAANYLIGPLRIDFLFAHRAYSKAMLERAKPLQVQGVGTAVVMPEDLIGLKLQALANDPSRSQDVQDIRGLIQAKRSELDEPLLREYFRLFGREQWLDELLKAD